MGFLPSLFGQTNLDRVLKLLNSASVPYVQVQQVDHGQNNVWLDAREKNEYEVSHLENAIWVGYKEFDLAKVTDQLADKDTPIVVYCSIGVRSEDIGEKLQQAGYTQVKNLYGGIFEWKNQGKPVYNGANVQTDSVHAYDKLWGRLLLKGTKVY